MNGVDAVNRKKRAAGDSSANGNASGDHRKRRRNRTTQSCLNCHASKRMCDRKRPACQRCTNLGLTGSCVYEIDDPNQRDNYQDDKDVLRNRVAELESVIREMKNKPHPRWFQRLASLAEDNERADAQKKDIEEVHLVADESSSSMKSKGESNGTSPISQYSSPLPSLEIPDSFIAMPRPLVHSAPGIKLAIVSPTPVATPDPRSENSTKHLHLLPPPSQYAFTFSSPLSSGSRAPSPVSDISPLGSFAGSPLTPGSPCLNVNGTLSAVPLDQSEFENGVFERLLDQIRVLRTDESESKPFDTKSDFVRQCCIKDHCGCMEEDGSYMIILELSARLRKAADALRRTRHHNIVSNCALFENIAELDRRVSNLISNTAPPSEKWASLLSSVFEQEIFRSSPDSLNSLSQNHSRSNSSEFIWSQQQWSGAAQDQPTDYVSPNDDTLMTWNSAEQTQWTNFSSGSIFMQ